MIAFDIEYAGTRTAVRIGAGGLPGIGSAMTDAGLAGRVLVVSDQTVAGLYVDPVLESLRAAGYEASLQAVPPGDESKSLARAAELYDRMAAGRLARDSTVLALGGGVVSDLAGFAAATWMRGVNFVICPTTLEADVDASVGGKTAVNHPAGKNLIGAFHQPRLVLIDPACLKSLPQRDLIAGLGESIKHAVIRDPAFLDWHLDHRDAILAADPDVLAELVARNVRIKADVVSADEREHGLRAVLNFGHTVGHAVESVGNYRWRHGECVGLGMVAASRISVRLGLLNEAIADRIGETLSAFGLPVKLDTPLPIDELRARLSHDKKVARSRVRFVLLEDLGRTVIRDDVPDAEITAALTALQP